MDIFTGATQIIETFAYHSHHKKTCYTFDHKLPLPTLDQLDTLPSRTR